MVGWREGAGTWVQLEGCPQMRKLRPERQGPCLLPLSDARSPPGPCTSASPVVTVQLFHCSGSGTAKRVVVPGPGIWMAGSEPGPAQRETGHCGYIMGTQPVTGQVGRPASRHWEDTTGSCPPDHSISALTLVFTGAQVCRSLSQWLWGLSVSF